MKKLILLAALDFVLAPGAAATGSPSCCRAPLQSLVTAQAVSGLSSAGAAPTMARCITLLRGTQI
jgi:hypothetical protein